ncbi:MBL fold metallo-hydrolase [Enterobacter hormaechei]|uniref:MBL fold metallo-hydrolase n=1 Tax=Enterobacter hormaechei TaxID=158836 RepID=UPI00277B9BEE|nr:MBL fold metallo-hydrolase [Enterobacter hormaechei]MDY3571638.1 MBL fold metallo-hydrolase [Enterobacter hormaechei]HDS5592949.1 MBL fold metallo-hydrolase [Enterobacter hormaechei subsp. xiangfangensis]
MMMTRWTKKFRLALITLTFSGICLASNTQSQIAYESGNLATKWLTGGPECAKFKDDFQVHKYNKNFYILRESGCVHTEKPFIYLLFGNEKAILFDTGAGKDTDATTGRVPDVVGTVNGVINQWLKENSRSSIHLIVTHLHSHFDHIWGDYQFTQRTDTTFVKPGDVETLKAFFGIKSWPEETGQYDLGGRVLDIIPAPGHDATSIAVYDRNTAVLLTGDVLYPGRLYINEPNPDLMQASIQRLVDFTRTRPVAQILGTHIERRAPYYDYPRGTHFAPDEFPLQMGRADLLELLEATKLRTRESSGNTITQKAYRNFTLCGAYPTCKPVNAPDSTVLINDL